MYPNLLEIMLEISTFRCQSWKKLRYKTTWKKQSGVQNNIEKTKWDAKQPGKNNMGCKTTWKKHRGYTSFFYVTGPGGGYASFFCLKSVTQQILIPSRWKKLRVLSVSQVLEKKQIWQNCGLEMSVLISFEEKNQGSHLPWGKTQCRSMKDPFKMTHATGFTGSTNVFFEPRILIVQ